MIYEIDTTLHRDKNIKKELGESLSNSNNGIFKEVGSCLYNLKGIKTSSNVITIKENARCNFELFEKGLLLRINDMQKFYLIALNPKEEIKIDIFEGKKTVILSLIGGILCLLGVNRNYLEKYWVFRKSLVYERFLLKIRTNEEIIILDSTGRNFEKAVKYFTNSMLREKITTHNTLCNLMAD